MISIIECDIIKIGEKMKVVKNIVVGFIAVVYFVFVIINTIFMLNMNDFGVTQFDEKTFVVIKSNISSEKYQKGDLVIVEKPRFDQIEIEDELFVYKIKKDEIGRASCRERV